MLLSSVKIPLVRPCHHRKYYPELGEARVYPTKSKPSINLVLKTAMIWEIFILIK